MAVEALRLIESKDEGSYTKEIAQEVSSSSTSISNLLKTFRENNIIERGKRTKAQYYKIDYNGLTSFWYEELLSSIQESEDDFFQNLEEDFKNNNEKIKSFSEKYFKHVISREDKSLTLKEFLFESYAFSLSRAKEKSLYESKRLNKNTEFPKYLSITLIALIQYIDMPDYSHVVRALLNIEDSDLSDAIEEM